MASRPFHALAVATALGLSACSGSGGGFTTGSLFGKSQPKVPDVRTERALQAAATSARASRCGYNFDAAKLRQGYLSYETAQGASPDELARAEKTYDFTRTTLAGNIAKEEDFCSGAKTREIKADLTRRLAGDFSVPPPKQEVQVSSGWFASPSDAKPMDREAIFDPLHRRRQEE